jgi:hypothetical protein
MRSKSIRNSRAVPPLLVSMAKAPERDGKRGASLITHRRLSPKASSSARSDCGLYSPHNSRYAE